MHGSQITYVIDEDSPWWDGSERGHVPERSLVPAAKSYRVSGGRQSGCAGLSAALGQTPAHQPLFHRVRQVRMSRDHAHRDSHPAALAQGHGGFKPD